MSARSHAKNRSRPANSFGARGQIPGDGRTTTETEADDARCFCSEIKPAYEPGCLTLSIAATTLPKTISITTMNVPTP